LRKGERAELSVAPWWTGVIPDEPWPTIVESDASRVEAAVGTDRSFFGNAPRFQFSSTTSSSSRLTLWPPSVMKNKKESRTLLTTFVVSSFLPFLESGLCFLRWSRRSRRRSRRSRGFRISLELAFRHCYVELVRAAGVVDGFLERMRLGA
jgi:hypothetical protein